MELALIDSNSDDDVDANESLMMIKRTSRHSWASAPSINPFLIHRLLAICIYRNILVINVFITFYYYLSIDCSFLFNSTLTCSNLQKQFDDDDGVLPRSMIDSIPTDTFPSCDGWVSISCFDLISILHLFCSSFTILYHLSVHSCLSCWMTSDTGALMYGEQYILPPILEAALQTGEWLWRPDQQPLGSLHMMFAVGRENYFD